MRRRGAFSFVGAIIVIAVGACTSGTEAASVLNESWTAYVRNFIQADGRVIDHSQGGISTSEGQAYAMLRAAWMDDRRTFDTVYKWGRNNLNSNVRRDRLWAWKWGRSPAGQWQVLDRAFASDADQDVALALLMAHKTWRDERYLADARATLADLWAVGTIAVGKQRILLGGDSLCTGTTCRINPSYFAPYAYRIFANADPGHDWRALIDSSYRILERASQLTATGLPPDWVLLNALDGQIRRSSDQDSRFSYDAFRVFWRVALDRELSGDSRADQYLRRGYAWFGPRLKDDVRLPAIIGSGGQSLADYESLEMLAGLMPGAGMIDAEIGARMNRKLQATYRAGSWGDGRSYYLQNWAWFGIALYDRQLAPFKQLK